MFGSFDNLFPSVRQEPTLGPWNESPFLQQNYADWAQYPSEKLTSSLMRFLGSSFLVVLLIIERQEWVYIGFTNVACASYRDESGLFWQDLLSS